jgi:hypothetical protein
VSDDFERRVARALAARVDGSAAGRSLVMDRVRRAAAEGHVPRRRLERAGTVVRGSFIGLAMAASVGGISALSAVLPTGRSIDGHASAVVLGDTVVASLHDTLRLVRLMFDAPSARRVTVAGDFNAWGARPVPLHRDPVSRRWAVTLALHAGEHRYAFVVDGTRWVSDPAARSSGRDHAGRVYSLLNVSRATN